MVDNLSYLAGIVDGEGCVGYHSNGNGGTRFVVEVKMTYEPIIDWLKNTYGGAKCYKPSTNPRWKDQWRWRIQGKAALALYAKLQPYLKLKGFIMGHSFEQSGPGDSIINMTRPDGHAHLDEKYDKGMRSPWLGVIGHQDAGLVSPETSPQSGSGHMDSGYSGTGGTGV